jgi:hypothetical protein
LACARTDDIESITVAKLGRVMICVARGKSEEALRSLEEIERNVSPIFRPLYYGVLAMSYMQSERPQIALDIANSVVEDILQYRFHSFIVEGYFYVLEVLLLIWEVDTQSKLMNSDLKAKTKALLTKIEAMVIKVPAAKPRAFIYKGIFEWLSGNLVKVIKGTLLVLT